MARPHVQGEVQDQMDRRKRLSGRGFTLIEVTLAIVIGVIMIAGATLLYNQSKISSGNSRAQAKVLALQQLVEEYAANNAGTYPTIESVRALFKRKRPDDYLKSPWGGQVGVILQNQADTGGTRGIADNSSKKGNSLADAPQGNGNESSQASPWSSSTGDGLTQAGLNVIPTGSVPKVDGDKMGGLSFSLNDAGAGNSPDAQNNTATASVYDVVTNVTKTVRGYAVFVYDQSGKYPNFVSGGRPE